MKGIIFNITESFLSEQYGEDKLQEIFEACGFIPRVYFKGPGTYPDEDWVRIISKASEILNITIPELHKELGCYSFLQLAEKFPQFVNVYKHPKQFLQTVDHLIHVEVRKMYADSIPPRFLYSEPSPHHLTITYISERRLYDFMEGLLKGVSRFYKLPFTQKKRIYQLDGVEVCDFELDFTVANAETQE